MDTAFIRRYKITSTYTLVFQAKTKEFLDQNETQTCVVLQISLNNYFMTCHESKQFKTHLMVRDLTKHLANHFMVGNGTIQHNIDFICGMGTKLLNNHFIPHNGTEQLHKYFIVYNRT